MRKATKKWTTKDGRKIRICDMTDEHLLNTIRLLERFAERKRDSQIAFLINYYPLGEMAQLDCDRAMDEVIESSTLDYVPDIYWGLIDEKNRREI